MLLFGALLISTPAVLAQKGKGKGHGNVEPYSITAQALKGATDTEVTVTLASDTPVDFPIPTLLKKLQLKMRNAEGEVVYNKNFQNLAVNGNQVVVSVPEPVQHNKLEVLAQIKTNATLDAEVLKTECEVLLRPDLVVESVTGPAEQHINTPFNIEAVIREINAQVGAVATVNLLLAGNLVGQVTGVTLSPGAQVSVVFVGLTNSEEGAADYSVVITDGTPLEFDLSNNTGNLSITFINPVLAVKQSIYDLSYYRYKNYRYHYYESDYYTGQLLYQYYQEAEIEGFYYTTYFNEASLNEGQLLTADYKIEKSNGETISGSFTDVAPYYYNYFGYNYYYSYDPVENIYFYGWNDPYWGYSGSQISRYRSNGIYFYYSYNGGSSYTYYTDPLNTFLDEEVELKVSMVTSFDDISFGGGAVLPIQPSQHYEDQNYYAYYDYYYGRWVNYWYTHSYDYLSAYSYGLTDPTMLPKAGVLENQELTQATFGLDKVYQNGSYATVEFSIPEDAPYTLEVMDMSGRKSVRIEEGKQAAGMQIKQVDVSNLQPGIYVFQLHSGQFVETKKVVLN